MTKKELEAVLAEESKSALDIYFVLGNYSKAADELIDARKKYIDAVKAFQSARLGFENKVKSLKEKEDDERSSDC